MLSGMPAVEPGVQELGQGGRGESGQVEQAGPFRVEFRRETQGVRHAEARAAREQHADRIAAEPPDDECERARRGPVEPLHVVDGQDDRARPGMEPKGRQHGC